MLKIEIVLFTIRQGVKKIKDYQPLFANRFGCILMLKIIPSTKINIWKYQQLWGDEMVVGFWFASDMQDGISC